MKKKYLLFLILILIGCSNAKTNDEKNNLGQKNAPITTIQNTEKEISSFTTQIVTKNKSRMKNINIAANILNNHIVGANEEFSFNGVVGKRTQERGFQKAIVFFKWGKSYADGGGVCQLSSTLYNTAKNAGMEIIERHDHLKEIYYLPIGQDAAVSYGSQDFRFKNTKPYPVKIVVNVNGNSSITIKLLSV